MKSYKRGTPDRALHDISRMFDECVDEKHKYLLSCWLSEYAQYIKQEKTFEAHFLKRYKRGEILKVNLGYRLGAEEGGAHYAIVLDKANSLYSGTITVLPLSSKKPTTKLNRYTLDLGDEIYQLLKAKAQLAFSNSITGIHLPTQPVLAGEEFTIKVDINYEETQLILDEINSMKEGSIALISQITSISKMRIMKPCRTTDALSNVCLNSETLNKIDSRISSLYLNGNYEE